MAPSAQRLACWVMLPAVAGCSGSPTRPASGPEAGASPPAPKSIEEASRVDGLLTACTPELEFSGVDAEGTAIVIEKLGSPTEVVQDTIFAICELLYVEPTEVRRVERVSFAIENWDGIAGKEGDSKITVKLSTQHLRRYEGHLGDEIRGILFHELTHAYQWDGNDYAAYHGLIEGMADFVRYRAGYVDPRPPGPEETWNVGYKTTGLFIGWLDDRHPGLARRLNLSLRLAPGELWSDQFFVDETGDTVDALWAEYRATSITDG